MSAPQPAASSRLHLLTDVWLGVDFVPIMSLERERAEPVAPASITVSNMMKDKEVPLDLCAVNAAALLELHHEHDKACAHCCSCTGYTQTVFGEGNPAAAIMFIGEAPGAEEDRTGRPFVGRAGEKLNDMITAIGLTREDVYIANILKSRPPNNRTPLADEVAGCAPYLARQIRIIRPRVIVALGGPASKFLLQTETGITRLRGQWGQYRDEEVCIEVMPTFHPAYLLRNYTRETRQKVWSDLQAAVKRLAAEVAREA